MEPLSFHLSIKCPAASLRGASIYSDARRYASQNLNQWTWFLLRWTDKLYSRRKYFIAQSTLHLENTEIILFWSVWKLDSGVGELVMDWVEES